MARLTTKQRKAMPKSEFGLPGEVHKGARGGKLTRGAYPMPDRAHAANAKARAKQQEKKGNLSASEAKTIMSKANRILYGKSKAPKGRRD